MAERKTFTEYELPGTPGPTSPDRNPWRWGVLARVRGEKPRDSWDLREPGQEAPFLAGYLAADAAIARGLAFYCDECGADQPRPAWTPVEYPVPEELRGRRVYVAFNRDRPEGGQEVTVATYYARFQLQAADHLEPGDDGVDESDDGELYALPGWYETAWGADEYYEIEGDVTHWQPLPSLPEVE